MRKIKTIVCGTKFGQYYIDALSKAKNDYELSGILAQGSRRSEKCAELYDIKLYRNVDEIPRDVELAIVVIRTSVMGGSGTNLIINLLKKGINVIAEQPIHERDVRECLKVALRNNVLFFISNIYKYMDAVIKYKQIIKTKIYHTKIKHIDVFIANQILFSAIEILEDIYMKDLEIQDKKTACGTLSKPVIDGEIGGIPISIKVENEIDDSDPDNFMPYMLNIRTYTDEGVLELYDVFGPIIWKPVINVVHDFFIKSKIEQELKTKTIYVDRCFSELEFEEVFSQYWITSITRMFNEVKYEFGMSDERIVSIKKKYQKIVENAIFWKKITGTIGYPIVFKSTKKKDVVKEFFNNTSVDVLDYVLEEERICCYTWKDIKIARMILDTACVESVYYSILKSVGIDIDKKISISKIHELAGNEINKERILKRWLSILEKEKYISINECEIKFNIVINDKKIKYNWERARKLLIPQFTNEDVLDYYIENGEKFSDILSGKINPMLLMFPNGDDERANKFYRQNIIEKLLAKEILNHVNQYADNYNKKIKILEIGAGTGATSEHIFLNTNFNENNCEYIFSDVSEYFLNKANLKFKNPYIIYKKIDFNKDLIKQGIEPKSIDIIISAGALNNAINIHDVIENLYRVIKDEGIILIAEPTGEHYEITLSQSFLMNVPNDERFESNSTFFTLEQWILALEEKNLESRNVHYWPENNNPLWELKEYLLYVKKRGLK